jgi:hypothetical protein
MSNTLGGLYSLSDRAKRRTKDFVRNPRAYLEQAVGQTRDQMGRSKNAQEVVAKTFDPSQENITAAVEWWNPAGPVSGLAGVIKNKGGGLPLRRLRPRLHEGKSELSGVCVHHDARRAWFCASAPSTREIW